MTSNLDKSPLVSIVTPAYNAESFIKATQESILSQDYQNWEWLCVVDKNSKDNTLALVQEFANKDIRIKCLTPQDRGGAANNRDYAITHSSGQYLAFLDADDLWAPNKLSRQIKYMQEHNVGFSFTGYDWIDEAGQTLGKSVVAPKIISYADLVSHKATIGCLTVIIDRNFFKDLKYEDIGAEDFTFWLKLLRQIPHAYGISESLGKYRIVAGSRSRNKLRWARHRWDSLRVAENMSLIPALYYFTFYAFRSVRNLI